VTPGGRGPDDGDDAEAFAEATRDAKPLAAGPKARVPLGPTARGGAPRAPRTAPVEAREAPARGGDAKLARALAAGEPRVEARLDLHGRPRREAEDALARFVSAARGRGARCLLVIHGRGAHSEADAPVLRPLVRRWLAERSKAAADAVLAFAPAPAAEGGEGATRVLLRKPAR